MGHHSYSPGSRLCLFHYDRSACDRGRIDAQVDRSPKDGRDCPLDRPPHGLFAVLFSPLIWLLNGIGNFLLGRLGFQPAEGHSQVHSPEELDMIFTKSHKGGEINQTEFEICTGWCASPIPTCGPSWFLSWKCKRCRSRSPVKPGEFPASGPHTRLPVYANSLDEILAW